MENLRNHQKNIRSRAKPGLAVKLIENIVVSEEKIKNLFSSSTDYEFDSSNSHSSLMFEGLTVKFTKTFFTAAVSYWEGKIIDKIHTRLRADFKTSLNDLLPQLAFCSMESFIMNSQELRKDQKIRGIVVVEPFLFASKFTPAEETFVSGLKKSKSTKPIYILSIMNDYDTLSKLAFIDPMVRIIMLFCINSEHELLNHIRVDGKDEGKIDIEAFKRIFYFDPCASLVKRLQISPDEATVLSQV